MLIKSIGTSQFHSVTTTTVDCLPYGTLTEFQDKKSRIHSPQDSTHEVTIASNKLELYTHQKLVNQFVTTIFHQFTVFNVTCYTHATNATNDPSTKARFIIVILDGPTSPPPPLNTNTLARCSRYIRYWTLM